MKKMFLFSLLAVVGFGFNKAEVKPKTEKNTYYFFCYSRAMASKGSLEKNRLFYTPVQKVEATEQEMKIYTKKFAQYIDNQCKASDKKCTSDLNMYLDKESADSVYESILNKYQKDENYTTQRLEIDFSK